MPHGSIDVGEVVVSALCDMVVAFPRPYRASFPDVPAQRWPQIRARHPDAFRGDEWLMHHHAYLVRSGGRTVLVDTGVGPSGTLAASWFGASGRLLEDLADAGFAPGDVDVVVLTHAHLDHIGWNLDLAADEPRPTFPNARYVLQRAEWERFPQVGDDDDRAAFDAGVRPLERLGVLDLIDGESRLAPGVTATPAPGHTPGHQVVLVESGEQRAAITGDLANHPAQVTDPSWRTGSDLDPDDAARSRTELFARFEADRSVVCTAHWPDPFARLVREDGMRFAAAFRP